MTKAINIFVALCFLVAFSLTASAAQDSPIFPDSPSGTVDTERQIVCQKLFQALLTRAPSQSEEQRAVAEIAAGRQASLVEALISSSEYRQIRSRSTAAGLLDQMFIGLLGRSPSASDRSAYEQQLSRSGDGAVVRTILDSQEFQNKISRGASAPSEATSACMEAVEAKVSNDRGKLTTLRFSNTEIAETSVFNESIKGEAELVDGSGTSLSFTCELERFGNRVTNVNYEVEETQATQDDQLIRCASVLFQSQRCPVDTSGGVTLERQEGRLPCIEGSTWGFDAEGVWVNKGCRGIFRIGASANRGIALATSGRGLSRLGGASNRLDSVTVQLSSDSTAELRFTGGSAERYTGKWFRSTEDRVELVLDSAKDSSRPGGAGSLTVVGDELRRIEMAGHGGYSGGDFELVFDAEEPLAGELRRAGEGWFELGDGRRTELTETLVTLEPGGKINLRFQTNQRQLVILAGDWFRGRSGAIQLALDTLGNNAISAGGSVQIKDGELEWIHLAGSLTEDGFVLSFTGR